tara:strand:+ start:421 stop:1506 length:1086 start_codon:yes stop_codon:yes gene_type:complete
MGITRDMADMRGKGGAVDNIIINGAMKIHQRGNQTTSNGSSIYFVDRFNVYTSAASAVANLQQSTDTPSGQGFGNSLLVDVTTADTSVGASEIIVLRQIIEGLNLQTLNYGTSSAESVTLSFWVKSPKTGVHICELWHFTSPVRTQSQSYTVSAANTWEKHSVTFSGDTTTALDNDNNYTLAVQWGLFAGTDYTSGTLATAWQDSGNANRYVGQQNFFDSTSNNFYLTGVVMEKGTSASDFPHEDMSTTLAKCQRYYQRIQCDTAYDAIMDGSHLVAAQFYAMHTFPVQMREVPTMGENGTISVVSNGADRAPDSFILNRATKEVVQTYCDMSTNNGVTGHAGQIRNNNDADQFVEFIAEL